MISTPHIALLSALLLGACAPDLGSGADAGVTADMMVDEMGGPQIGHVDEGDGIVRTTIDATSEDTWIYMSLRDGTQIQVADPLTDTSWDLGFRRFNIELDGGVSGSAGLDAARLSDTMLEDVEVAPAAGYVADARDGDDDDEDPDYALRDWYSYSVMTHVLTPRPDVYVIRTGDGRFYALAVEDYYDDAGTSGYPTFRWTAIDPP